jgi:hypothetical protein
MPWGTWFPTLTRSLAIPGHDGELTRQTLHNYRLLPASSTWTIRSIFRMDPGLVRGPTRDARDTAAPGRACSCTLWLRDCAPDFLTVCRAMRSWSAMSLFDRPSSSIAGAWASRAMRTSLLRQLAGRSGRRAGHPLSEIADTAANTTTARQQRWVRQRIPRSTSAPGTSRSQD